MSFRKRNTPLPTSGSSSAQPLIQALPGTRLSPQGGRLVTSTGTPSLDDLLGGFAGLPLGASLLLGESGTTDNASTLLRCYAAEGLLQGHVVHVIGVSRDWIHLLPGLVGPADGESRSQSARLGPLDEANMEKHEEQMKIAWRYERYGGRRAVDKVRDLPWLITFAASAVAVDRTRYAVNSDACATQSEADTLIFCHTFDLTKRLEDPHLASIQFHPIEIGGSTTGASPFPKAMQSLCLQLSSSPPNTVHRLVMPSLLSPLVYPPAACEPRHALAFLHGLRSLLRQHAARFTVMASLPLELFPRSTGLVRWMELLCDAVLELNPLPRREDDESRTTSTAAPTNEERPQGMIKVHKLPIIEENSGGAPTAMARALGDDLAFTVSRRRFVIKPFTLPPAIGGIEAQKEAGRAEGKIAKERMEF